MVAVGDVEGLDRGEPFRDRPDLRRIPDDPYGVADAIVRREGIFGRSFSNLRRQTVDCPFPAVGEKDRPRLRSDRIDVKRPLPLLVRPGEFVASDPPALILGEADAGRNPRLDVIPHLLTVEVKRGGLLWDKDPLMDQGLQILFRPLVDPAVIHAGGIGKIDLRFLHMQKTQRVVADLLPAPPPRSEHHRAGRQPDGQPAFRVSAHGTEPLGTYDLLLSKPSKC